MREQLFISLKNAEHSVSFAVLIFALANF